MPLAMVLSPEGDRVVVLLNGWREQGVQVVDRKTGHVLQTLEQAAAFIGLEFSPDGKTLYASGGNQDVVYRYDWQNHAATLRDSIVLAWKAANKAGTRYPAGLHASRDGKLLFVAENITDNLAVVDVQTGEVVQRLPTGRYPYAVAEDAEGHIIVSAWGANTIAVFSAPANGQEGRLITTITGIRHPSAMIVNRAGTKLFVASGSTDRVFVLDTHLYRVTEQLLGPPPTGPGEGSTPNALALSRDEMRLYVAEADNNAVAVWDLRGAARLLGRVPVGWYPSALLAAGDTVLVANGKGTSGTAPNPRLPQPGTGTQNDSPERRRSYTLGQITGSLTTLTEHELGNSAMSAMSHRVAVANNWTYAKQPFTYPPFTHVLYIIKENRTYDQMLGDVREGDGDTALAFFPQPVTPNAHALAARFGLFDRFFVNAEVSADGHNWTTAAYATDYLEKTVPSEYSDRGRSYDYEGTNRNRIPSEHGEEDAAEPANGYLWDLAQRSGVTLRNYGEYVVEDEKHPGMFRGTKPYLAANTNPSFPAFDMNIRDQKRADIYIDELKQFSQRGEMPQLQIIRLPRDHTSGARANANTPRAMVADNDLALGRIVEAISVSPFWKNTVIFVLEDDAQNGPDHVDSHRSPLLVISAYNRPGVIHRFANTTDVIATIAEILKLGALSQFDYFGRPLREAFARSPDLAPFRAVTPSVDLNEMNPPRGRGAMESRKLNLAQEDRSDDELFNRILWRAIKGDAAPYPGPTRMSALEWKRAR